MMRKAKISVTLERVKDVLEYDPITGEFRWKKPLKKAMRVGERAGTNHGNGYRAIGIDGQLIYEHRLAVFYMTGEWPKEQVDHVNRNRSDNRWRNLREASSAQNSGNSSVRSDSETGIKGVGWCKAKQKWRAFMGSGGKYVHLGYYDDIGSAAEAYKEASKKRFGDFSSSAITDTDPAINFYAWENAA